MGDIYTWLLHFINQAINQATDWNPKFKYIKFTRKNVKQPIITKTYNVSVYGIAYQLINTFKKELGQFIPLKHSKNGIYGNSKVGFLGSVNKYAYFYRQNLGIPKLRVRSSSRVRKVNKHKALTD